MNKGSPYIAHYKQLKWLNSEIIGEFASSAGGVGAVHFYHNSYF